MPIEFDVKVVETPSGTKAVRVALIGDLDAHTAGEFNEVLEKLLVKNAKNVVVECDKLGYINSTGLAALLNYTDLFSAEGGQMVLSGVPDGVMQVIELMGFEKELKIVQNVPSAFVWFESPPPTGKS